LIYRGNTVGAKPVTEAEEKELQRQSDEVYESLTHDEFDAIGEYTKKKFKQINVYLNIGNTTDPKIPGYVKHIDSAMAKFELKDRITVFKGTNAAWYNGWEIGRVEPIKQYLSTSVSRNVALKYKDNVRHEGDEPIILEINVPKGTRGIYIGNNTDAREDEFEFLAGHGLKYRVIERNGDTLKMEVVP
jgi:hypothetical protein